MVKCSANAVVYDSVQTWLAMFLDSLNPRNNGQLHGMLLTFDQTEFGASPNLSMAATGSVFVPQSCTEGRKCGVAACSSRRWSAFAG